MSRYTLPLDSVQVASPCDILWEEMKGSDRVRFCGHCERSVYNLSAMTRSEAEEFILEREGRLCVRFYRRTDGTVLTEDCPVGLRAARRQVALIVGATAAAVFAVAAWGMAFLGFLIYGANNPWRPMPEQVQPGLWTDRDLIMGKMCPPEVPLDVPEIEVPPEKPPPLEQQAP